MSSTENRRQVPFSSFHDIEEFVLEQLRELEKVNYDRPLLPRVIYVNPDVPKDALIYHYDTDGRMVLYIHPASYYDMLINSRYEISFGSSFDMLSPIGVPIVKEDVYRFEVIVKQKMIDLWVEDMGGWPKRGMTPKENATYLRWARAAVTPQPHRHASPSQRRRPPSPTPPVWLSPGPASDGS